MYIPRDIPTSQALGNPGNNDICGPLSIAGTTPCALGIFIVLLAVLALIFLFFGLPLCFQWRDRVRQRKFRANIEVQRSKHSHFTRMPIRSHTRCHQTLAAAYNVETDEKPPAYDFYARDAIRLCDDKQCARFSMQATETTLPPGLLTRDSHPTLSQPSSDGSLL